MPGRFSQKAQVERALIVLFGGQNTFLSGDNPKMLQVNAVGTCGPFTATTLRNSLTQDGQVWDVFLSHASEDKERVAQPLYDAPTCGGLRVWLDEKTMAIGDSLRRSIDQGIRSSTFSTIVLSPHYLKKGINTS